MSLYSNGGVQLAGRQPGLNGKPAADLPAEVKAAIKDGRPAEYRSDDGFRHFIMPIVVGEAGTQWAVRISIPEDEAFAPVRAASWQSAFISLGILALILLLLSATLNQLLRPLGRLQGWPPAAAISPASCPSPAATRSARRPARSTPLLARCAG